MLKNRKKIACLFFIIFIFSIIISSSFMLGHVEHSCIGDDCNICYEINLMKSIFKNFLIVSLAYVFVKKFIVFLTRIRYVWQLNYSLTPVKLKVKMTE